MTLQRSPLNSLPPALALAGLLLASGGHAQQAPPVTSTVVEDQPIERELRVSGTVTTPRSATLSTAVGGLIQVLDVDAGHRVEAGELLVQLDPELDTIALDGARAAEAAALAELEEARRRLEEARRLREDRGIAETEVLTRATAAERSEAAHQAAIAERRRQEAILERHRIRAPFAGVISQRLAELGEWVSPGDQLLELVATDGLRFDFQVPQEYFPRLSMDTPVELSVDALPGERFPGHIQAIVPVSDPGARTFLLRALSDAPRKLTPGMSARGILRMATGRRAVVVPRDALLRYPDGRTTVWLVERTGEGARVREQLVETGLETATGIELREGVEPGSEVVTRGNESLQDGQQVSIR